MRDKNFLKNRNLKSDMNESRLASKCYRILTQLTMPMEIPKERDECQCEHNKTVSKRNDKAQSKKEEERWKMAPETMDSASTSNATYYERIQH